MKSWRFGVSILSDEKSILGAARNGFEFVELAFVPPLKGRIRLLLRNLKMLGLTPTSLHGPFGPSCDFGNFDLQRRKSALKSHVDHLQYCAELGAKYYVVHAGLENYVFGRDGERESRKKIGTLSSGSEVHKLWTTNALSLATLADVAEDFGLAIALETGFSNVITVNETLEIVRLAGCKNVKVCVDTGHINIGGKIKPSEAIREVGRLLIGLHLNDNNGDGDSHLPPGRGRIDWHAVLDSLRDISYEGRLNIELKLANWKGESSWKDVNEGVSVLRRLLEVGHQSRTNEL